MLDSEQELKIATRNGLLSNFKVMREGPAGSLYSAETTPAQGSAGPARCFVYIPSQGARAGYLERLKKIERLAYHGWMIPDSIVRDESLGLAAIYRIEHGTPLSEATEEQLGSLTQRVLLTARLCRVIAHGHDMEIFHGRLAEDLVICNDGYPMLIDAPVGNEESCAQEPAPCGRAATDMQAIGAILTNLTLGPRTLRPEEDEPADMLDDIGRIVRAAYADEHSTRFIQVMEMADRLRSLADNRPHRVQYRGSRWKTWLGAATAAAVVSLTVFIMAERKNGHEIRVLHARVAEAESQLEAQRHETARLADKLDILPSLQDRGFDMMRFSHQHGVTPDSLLMFAAMEQILWPIGVERSHLASRLSFQSDRLLAGRRFIDEAYARSDDHNLEVIVTELLVGTWELEAGEYHAASDTLGRVVPKLVVIARDDDPLAVGARQLMSYASDLANNRLLTTPSDYEVWVKRVIDVANSAMTNAAGPYGELYRPFAEQTDCDETEQHNLEFTRSIMKRESLVVPFSTESGT